MSELINIFSLTHIPLIICVYIYLSVSLSTYVPIYLSIYHYFLGAHITTKPMVMSSLL